jgi:hypothetical protein
MYNHNVIESPIFDYGRKLIKEISDAEKLLKKNGYVVYEKKRTK